MKEILKLIACLPECTIRFQNGSIETMESDGYRFMCGHLSPEEALIDGTVFLMKKMVEQGIKKLMIEQLEKE